MPRSKLLVTLSVVLIGAAALWYVWMLVSARLELGGASPDRQTLGRVQDPQQRAMTQYCTGVVATPQGTWLVGRVEARSNLLPAAPEALDLDALVYGKVGEPQEEEGSGAFASLMQPREKEVSFISRLDANGQFQRIAQVGEVACLVASPDGSSVFLLTGLKRPQTAGRDDAISQTVVLRSDDQGKSWTWLRQGLFPQVESLAENLRPYFHGPDEIWALGTPSGLDNEDGTDRPGAIATGLFYSADRGASSTPIVAAESLLVPAEYAHGTRPEVREWHSGDPYGEIRNHVVQLDAQRAVLWVSQRFWGSHPDGVSDHIAATVTTRAQLQRSGGHWQVTSLQREDGLYVDALEDNGAGRIVGVIDQGTGSRDRVAELDTTTFAWRVLSELPSVFAPLASDSHLRGGNFWVGRNSLVVNTWSEHRPPRWLYGWSDASISASATFYSKDWGQSWQRLAIDGYLGTLGFQGAEDRVIWAKGNWYNSNDLGIYSYGLQ
ncbi:MULTISPECIES: hypothetical protein [unclassified Pseudomonas]|uniref:hypothetical protein n=1 Tax=unclassified Pseudomonas TaxID=196821 RepID=UPI000997D3FF|nr:hypothetical protein [Pseudomonas sp. MF4836]OOV92046.1 hypothetical protein MF4836_25345 [Pseudomonas sp. MF4836]